MTGSDVLSFGARFSAPTGHSPIRWQCRLFERLAANDLPETCDIPSGLGKTSVLPIWLLAVAQQAEASELRMPRRLVYVVNRRTVVDQATDIVEHMRSRQAPANGGRRCYAGWSGWPGQARTPRALVSLPAGCGRPAPITPRAA